MSKVKLSELIAMRKEIKQIGEKCNLNVIGVFGDIVSEK